MTEDSKQQANLAVNVLRKFLYQEHGWTEPIDSLVQFYMGYTHHPLIVERSSIRGFAADCPILI